MNARSWFYAQSFNGRLADSPTRKLDDAARKLGTSHGRERSESPELINCPAIPAEKVCGYCEQSPAVIWHHGVASCAACAMPVKANGTDFPARSSMGAPAWADEEPGAIIARRKGGR